MGVVWGLELQERFVVEGLGFRAFVCRVPQPKP